MQQGPEGRGAAEEPTPEEMARTTRRSDRLDDVVAKEEGRRLFPYNAVVGVVDDPAQVGEAVRELIASGVAEEDVQVLCGEEGVRRIDMRGERKGILARIFRVVDRVGEEHEHTARHVEELQAGHFLFVVDAPDDIVKTRVRNALVTHGGHFVNYYSRWSTENLVP